MKRLLFRLIQVLLAALLAFGGWCGWYVSSHGFTRKWRGLVSRELRARGVDVYVHRLTLDPFHGLVAREVRVMDSAHPEQVLAVIDRAALDINYNNLLRGGSVLDGVDLRNADLSLPLDPAGADSPRLEISRLNARLLLPPHEWYLSEAEAIVAGVQVSARGRLLNPEALRSAEPKKGRADSQQTVLAVMDELRRLRADAGPPRVEVEFGGDLADPRSIFAAGTLWAQGIRRGSYNIENAFAAWTFREGVLDLRRCVISDALGALEASGTCDTRTGAAALQVRSTLDLQALAHSLRVPHVLDDWVFYSAPRVEFSAEGNVNAPASMKVLGRVALEKFAAKSVMFDGAGAEFSLAENRWYLRDAALRNRTGQIAANALQTPDGFRAELHSTINPNTLRPFLSGKAAEAFGDWDFAQSPALDLAVSGPSPEPEKLEATGEIQLGHTRMRGVPLNAARAKIGFKNKTLSCENFRIEREEGVATGTFAYDFGLHQAHLTDVRARLNPPDVMTWIDRDIVQHVSPYRFKAAPSAVVNGVVSGHAPETRLEVLVDAPAGMDYTFLKKTLSFPKISGKLLFVGRELRISDLAASLYGGRLRGGAEISLEREKPGYTARIAAENVDFASVTKLYFNYANSQGLVNGAFDFRGKSSDPRTLSGRGEIAISEGNVFAIPLLGPFSGILNSIVPGMGYNVAHRGACSFEVRDGTIATRDFLVEGKGFSMIGGGSLFFLDDKMDFNIRLNAQGLPGVLLFPVSKLFEYTSEGTLSKPAWRPKRLPALGSAR